MGSAEPPKSGTSSRRPIPYDRPARDAVRWHRAGFRCYWRWKSRPFGGRPQIDMELRALIRRRNVENPLWSAPRIQARV